MKRPKRIVLHAQLTQSLVAELASGFYVTGRRFLSNRKICRLWNVSETTAKLSLGQLVREGFIEVRHRSGYYVRPGSQEQALLRLHHGPTPKLPPPLTWEVKKFQLLPRAADQPLHIAVILGGKTKLPAEGLGQLPSRHHFAQLVYATSLFQEAMRHRCQVHFYVDNGNAARRDTIIAQILQRHPAGVIAFRRLLSYAPLQPMIAPLVAAHIPVVTVFDDCEQLHVASININNVGMGYDAVQRFLNLGHRCIAVLIPRITNRYFSDRARGAQMALADAGLADARLQVWRLALSGPLPKKFLAEFRDPRHRPTAVVVTVASLFRQFWPLVKRLRLRVPRDLSLIMCAGRPCLPEYKRSFDTLQIDFEALGRTAFTRLLEFRAGKLADRALALDLPYVRTGSVSAPAPTRGAAERARRCGGRGSRGRRPAA